MAMAPRSFYQPLYLYWDWIAANNPYHYVSAKAGNGNWTDPAHWVDQSRSELQIIDADGNLVNGVPTTPGAGRHRHQPGFGQACFQIGGVSDCYDVDTGDETVDGHADRHRRRHGDCGQCGTGRRRQRSRSTVRQTMPRSVAAPACRRRRGTADVANVPAVAAVLPAATLANGLPGATNFVPNNDDGDRLTGTAPRYFDVTLSATGTTTLDTAVTVDRFAIAGAGAALDITAAGSLTSLIDINQLTGAITGQWHADHARRLSS